MTKPAPAWKKGRSTLGPLAPVLGGFRWAVEAKNKKGRKRFTEHHDRPA